LAVKRKGAFGNQVHGHCERRFSLILSQVSCQAEIPVLVRFLCPYIYGIVVGGKKKQVLEVLRMAMDDSLHA